MDHNSLKKFNQLPSALKVKFSAPEIISHIERLENKYRLKLAMVFIALAVNDLDSSDLESYLLGALGASPEAANDISRVFLSLLGQTAVPRPLAEVAPKPAFGLPPARPAIADGENNPSLTFSTEDEAEIDHYRPLVNGYKKQSYETIAQGIVAEIGYQVDDMVLAKRLENIIVARLKQVRDDIETLEVLQRNTKVGGMGFSEEQAQSLLKSIKSRLADSRPKEVVASKLDFAAPKPPAPNGSKLSLKAKAEKEQAMAIDFDLNKLKSFGKAAEAEPKFSEQSWPSKASQERPASAEKRSLPEIDEEDGLPVLKLPGDDDLMVKPHQIDIGAKPTADKPRSLAADAVNQPPRPPIQPPVFRPEPVPRPVGQVKASAPPVLKRVADRKPPLDGVKVAPKLVGPIEELSGMTLIDFRRLGNNPQQMISEIKEKINLLAEDSYGKKLEGVDAWHQSEVNRFYRLLGQASMMEGKSVETIISERLAAGKPTLSLEEFNAVMELNKELRY